MNWSKCGTEQLKDDRSEADTHDRETRKNSFIAWAETHKNAKRKMCLRVEQIWINKTIKNKIIILDFVNLSNLEINNLFFASVFFRLIFSRWTDTLTECVTCFGARCRLLIRSLGQWAIRMHFNVVRISFRPTTNYEARLSHPTWDKSRFHDVIIIARNTFKSLSLFRFFWKRKKNHFKEFICIFRSFYFIQILNDKCRSVQI